ncbi:transcription termination/antitermination protein NusA [Candidatus Peregrinibacteria bacterium]|jgi:transcription termination/antitermination protein NusA|nr:transcription termination/antitermination protein NusA [Candidatus Peregrinibacteria bacterium]MBT4632344.1 transcription termination/antitermination protein NusA [Candidatus Peregrinibacteria bacterium]MBT5517122.1 transcription termination/antitermination protein NusA [Candidatus Peregrinibacteria bacterium]MBT5824032.1 transcription termination/antitermination protein NusA [Candidatus Peregrinibacteria bacterium]
MHHQFMSAIRQLCSEKSLPEETILEIVEAAIRTAYRKDYGTKDQVIDVDIDAKTENVSVFIVKEVVDEVENEEYEISLSAAKKINKDIKVEEEVRIDVTPISYGRIAAQAAKQVIIQRIQEAERDFMFETFKERQNELINALIHRVDNNHVYVELGGITALLPAREQIPTEQYYGGQRIKLYLDKVIKTNKGPQLLISRTHPKLVAKLMELEIPEIKAGTVEIKGIAREPGVRCKVAVHSNDEQVDPIGACVGQGGSRVQTITQELSGERIDVIPWDENAAKFIQEALKPAKIAKVEVEEDKKLAKVYVAQDQRALAIGKNGQNVRLASNLTGWEIDILDADPDMSPAPAGKSSEGSGGKSSSSAAAKPAEPEVVMMITELDLSDEIKEKLAAVSLEQVAQLKGLSAKDFTQVDGVTEEEAEQIVEAVKGAK